MPAPLPFDTLDYARKLERAGVPTAQAELQAQALGEALASTVATRGDLASLESRLELRFARIDARFEQVDARFEQVDARFEHLEAKMNARFEALESRLNARIDALKLELGGRIDRLQWMFGVLVALNGATLIQLFLKQ